MTIAPDLTAQILRYHHAERWPVGTISSQLNVHRETVMRVWEDCPGLVKEEDANGVKGPCQPTSARAPFPAPACARLASS